MSEDSTITLPGSNELNILAEESDVTSTLVIEDADAKKDLKSILKKCGQELVDGGYEDFLLVGKTQDDEKVIVSESDFPKKKESE